MRKQHIFWWGVPFIGLAACTPTSQIGVCDGTEAARSNHATALVEDGGPQSRATGRDLIALIDSGCP